MPSLVTLPKQIYEEISRWADKAYPHEGCGLLIGHMKGQKKDVVRFAPLTNKVLNSAPDKRSAVDEARFSTLPDQRKQAGAGKTEFVMDPEEFNRETLKAEKDGLDVVGILHTHPDHPPRPSAIDASQPFLAQWSNIIVSVEKGKTKEMKSWFRETDDQPFSEELIEHK
jgi:proteasome lid subunit RPN8/RPN11